jgi:hypothetical protein
MKRYLKVSLGASLVACVCAFLWACESNNGVLSNTTTSSDEAILAQARLDAEAVVQSLGNGAPSGAHYNLNMIGVPKDKTADMTNNSGHRIFTKLEGKTKVMLAEGDFAVLDANGTDGTASFQLPNPDPENTGTTKYSVFARALGTPGGSAQITTCATDTAGVQYCSVYSTIQTRDKGNSTFTDISRDLLYIYADLNADGTLERYPLFSNELQGYFWDYDNSGLKLLQLRFYPVPSNVGG